MPRKISAEHRAKIIRTASENARKVREFDRLLAMVDALLNHCDKDGGECRVCSQIVCPYKDPLHFHHDGCPSCCQEEDARAAQPPGDGQSGTAPKRSHTLLACGDPIPEGGCGCRRDGVPIMRAQCFFHGSGHAG